MQEVKDPVRELGRRVELPAQFTDIGETGSTHGEETDVDQLRGTEGERLVREVCLRDAGEQLARLRAHKAEHRVGTRHVDDFNMHVVGGMAVDPVGIAHDGCRTRHPHELVMGNTGDRDVGLVGAALIEHACVHDITSGNVHVSSA